MKGLSEANITINGVPLSTGQAMAVRVAVGSFYAEMKDPTVLGDDEHGRAMTIGYRERLLEVLRLLS